MVCAQLRLSWQQKFAVLCDCNRPGVSGEVRDTDGIGKWAQHELRLSKQPFYHTIIRILHDEEKVRNKISSVERAKKQILRPICESVEQELVEWVMEM